MVPQGLMFLQFTFAWEPCRLESQVAWDATRTKTIFFSRSMVGGDVKFPMPLVGYNIEQDDPRGATHFQILARPGVPQKVIVIKDICPPHLNNEAYIIYKLYFGTH